MLFSCASTWFYLDVVVGGAGGIDESSSSGVVVGGAGGIDESSSSGVVVGGVDAVGDYSSSDDFVSGVPWSGMRKGKCSGDGKLVCGSIEYMV